MLDKVNTLDIGREGGGEGWREEKERGRKRKGGWRRRDNGEGVRIGRYERRGREGRRVTEGGKEEREGER